MKDFLWISLGAAIGANLRFGVNHPSAKYLSASAP
jgi:fluoride ion exporter CrcB/FEX